MANMAKLNSTKYDEFYTPPEAIYPLLKYIPRDWVVFEPTHVRHPDFTGQIVTVFEQNGYRVLWRDHSEGYDFFRDGLDGLEDEVDVIVTNPPYSTKDEWLERLFEIGKPFALLLPLTALEGRRRQQMFRRYGIELILLDRRVKFFQYDDRNGRVVRTKSPWFAVGWFCWRILGQRNAMVFERLREVPAKTMELAF